MMIKFPMAVHLTAAMVLTAPAVAPLASDVLTAKVNCTTQAGIVIQRANFSPEGIEYNPRSGRYLVGSVAEGTVYEVSKSGLATPFIIDRDLKSSVGIRVDAARNRLLVTNTDPAVFADPVFKGSAKLGSYNLATGKREYMVDLGALYPKGRHFAEDVAVDDAGNAYVTDAFSPIIYKIDRYGIASVLVEDERLGNSTFGLNGIAFHPHGYLIVAVDGDKALFKIPLNAPRALSRVTLDTPIAGDGMVIDRSGRLYAVDAGDTYSVKLLTSSDEWKSAAVKAAVSASPPTRRITTLVVHKGQVHALYTTFDQVAPIGTYEIVPISLDQHR